MNTLIVSIPLLSPREEQKRRAEIRGAIRELEDEWDPTLPLRLQMEGIVKRTMLREILEHEFANPDLVFQMLARVYEAEHLSWEDFQSSVTEVAYLVYGAKKLPAVGPRLVA